MSLPVAPCLCLLPQVSACCPMSLPFAPYLCLLPHVSALCFLPPTVFAASCPPPPTSSSIFACPARLLFLIFSFILALSKYLHFQLPADLFIYSFIHIVTNPQLSYPHTYTSTRPISKLPTWASRSFPDWACWLVLSCLLAQPASPTTKLPRNRHHRTHRQMRLLCARAEPSADAMALGDVSCHHGWTLHCAPPNQETRQRCVRA
eukprot:178593-Pleurochrysis_carterae.AAC.1